MLSRRFVLPIFCLALSGCVTAEKIIGPDGSESQLVTCPTVKDCYEKAREVCGGNYKIINTSSETSGAAGMASTDVSLLVKCAR